MNHTRAWRVSDELAIQPVEELVSVSRHLWIILAFLLIDLIKNLQHGTRPFPISDQGKAISELLS